MRRWLFLVATSLSFAAFGCGSDNPGTTIDGGPQADAKPTVDAGPADARLDGGGTPDARVIDAGTTLIDANLSTPDAGPTNTVDAPPQPDAPCAVTVCGANTSGFFCGPGGGRIECQAATNGCPEALPEVSCGDTGLVCSGAGPTATCECPAATGTTAGTGCPTDGQKICETPDANGESNVLICTTVGACKQWQVFGGADDPNATGNCKAAHLTCANLTCSCPVNSGSTFFANSTVDRTQANTRNVAATGVQNPAACAFPTVGAAMSKATQFIQGTSNRATVVLSGASATTPALFSEPPFAVPDRILVTVDTDPAANGVQNPAGVPFDPRLQILVITPPNGSAATGVTLSPGAGGGGQVYGFTIASGPCITGSAPVAACSNTSGTALVVGAGAGADGPVATGNRARVSNMFLEGASGAIFATSADLGAMALTGGGPPTGIVTATVNSTDSLTAARSVTILPVPGDLSSIAFAGAYRITAPVEGPTDVWTFTFYTNKTVVPASVTNYSLATEGAFGTGISLTGTAGSVDKVVAENFNFTGADVGIHVASAAGPAGYPFTGLYAYNNSTGMVVSDGAVSIADATIGGVKGSVIEHSLSLGLLVGNNVGKLPATGLPVVTATNLSVFNSQGDGIGVVDAGTLALTGSSVTNNAGRGVVVIGNAVLPATQTLIATGSSFTGNALGIDVQEGNTTLIDSHVDGNTVVGLDIDEASNATTVSIAGGTIDGNFIGVQVEVDTAAKVVTGASAASGTVSIASNDSSGLIAHDGTLTLAHTVFTLNGGNSGDCEAGVDHEAAVVLTDSARADISDSSISINNGGGLVVESAGNTIASTTVENNGSTNDCDNDFSGIVVDGGDLTFTGGVSTANLNKANGIEIGPNGTVTSAAGSGFQANTNAQSGIVLVDATSTATLTVGGTVSGNCTVGSPSCAGIENHGTTTAEGVVVTTNVTAGVRNYGAFDGTALHIDHNTDGFWNDSTLNATVVQSTITANTANGVHVLQSATSGTPFANDDPIGAWGVVLDHDTITSNTGNGVLIGGTGQTGDISAIVQNTDIGLNGGTGVTAIGTATAGTRTGVSLITNVIEQNVGSGLAITSAFIKDAILFTNQFFTGISQNVIAHNGYPIPDPSVCTAGETAPQVSVAGTDPAPASAFDCTTQATNDACLTHAVDRCIFVSASTGCRRAYQISGNTGENTCNQANTIAGYEAHFVTVTGAATAGVAAAAGPGPAFVNVSNNIWARSPPVVSSDFQAEAGSAIGPTGFTSCGTSVLSTGCPLFGAQ